MLNVAWKSFASLSVRTANWSNLGNDKTSSCRTLGVVITWWWTRGWRRDGWYSFVPVFVRWEWEVDWSFPGPLLRRRTESYQGSQPNPIDSKNMCREPWKSIYSLLCQCNRSVLRWCVQHPRNRAERVERICSFDWLAPANRYSSSAHPRWAEYYWWRILYPSEHELDWSFHNRSRHAGESCNDTVWWSSPPRVPEAKEELKQNRCRIEWNPGSTDRSLVIDCRFVLWLFSDIHPLDQCESIDDRVRSWDGSRWWRWSSFLSKTTQAQFDFFFCCFLFRRPLNWTVASTAVSSSSGLASMRCNRSQQ